MIRKATINDAKEFCQVLRISIIELCKKDYGNNDIILEKWLSNKTIENCKKWILDNNTNTFVVEYHNKIVGVSQIGHNGFLYLCYLLPEVKGMGFGKKLLEESEKSISDYDFEFYSLESTITSKGFYEHFGYREKDNFQYYKEKKA